MKKFIAASFVIVKKKKTWKQAECTLIGQRLRKSGSIYIKECSVAIKNYKRKLYKLTEICRQYFAR